MDAQEDDNDGDDEWSGHPLRKFLRDRLEDKSIPLSGKEMGTVAVWNKYCDEHPDLFEGMRCDKLFAGRLSSLRGQIKADLRRADRDQERFDIHRLNFPYCQWKDSGEPNWRDHPAKQLLEDDIDFGLYLPTMKPKDLYATREEYQEFSLKVFRGHIHQHIKTKKYLHTLRVRDEEKAEERRIAREKKKEAAALKAARKAKKEAEQAAKEEAKEAKRVAKEAKRLEKEAKRVDREAKKAARKAAADAKKAAMDAKKAAKAAR
jgi:hypothetical protein